MIRILSLIYFWGQVLTENGSVLPTLYWLCVIITNLDRQDQRRQYVSAAPDSQEMYIRINGCSGKSTFFFILRVTKYWDVSAHTKVYASREGHTKIGCCERTL